MPAPQLLAFLPKPILFALYGAIGGLLFHALPVSARESGIIGSLFFVAAAILFFLRPSDDQEP